MGMKRELQGQYITISTVGEKAHAYEDGQRIKCLKRISGSTHLIHKAVLERPMASPNWIQEKTQLSPATVKACMRDLEQLGIVTEMTGQKRNCLFFYVKYIQIMNKGTELPR